MNVVLDGLWFNDSHVAEENKLSVLISDWLQMSCDLKLQVSDGGWVDCVRVEEQIAAHHPSLKDHVIQVLDYTGLKSMCVMST